MLLFLLLVSFTACRQERAATGKTGTVLQGEEHPAWLAQLIREQQQRKAANPPAKIFRYAYRGQPVYYLTGRCCDVPSQLFDGSGQLLCEPDGGLTGQGDGKCPNFFDNRTEETLIWEDKR